MCSRQERPWPSPARLCCQHTGLRGGGDRRSPKPPGACDEIPLPIHVFIPISSSSRSPAVAPVLPGCPSTSAAIHRLQMPVAPLSRTSATTADESPLDNDVAAASAVVHALPNWDDASTIDDLPALLQPCIRQELQRSNVATNELFEIAANGPAIRVRQASNPRGGSGVRKRAQPQNAVDPAIKRRQAAFGVQPLGVKIVSASASNEEWFF